MKIAIALIIPILLAAGCISQAQAGEPQKLGALSLERIGFSEDRFEDGETKSYRISVENVFNLSMGYRVEFLPEDRSFLEITHAGTEVGSIVFDPIQPKERTIARVVDITGHTPVAKAETLLSIRLYAVRDNETLVEERNLTISIQKKR